MCNKPSAQTRGYRLIIVGLSAFLLASMVHPWTTLAALHYIRSNASGANSGTNWTNAFTELPSSLIRGDTYYLADGSYPGYTFNDPISGTTKIIIKKATQANHGTDSGWESSFGDAVASFSGQLVFTTSYWTLDGQVGLGSSGHGIYIDRTTGGKGIRLTGDAPSHITIQFVEIEGNGRDGDGGGNDMVYVVPTSGTASNLTFRHLHLHDCGRVQFLFRNSNTVLVEHSYMARNDNHTGEHSEAVSAFGGTDNFTFRYNTWVDIEGTGIIMFEGDNLQVYGNIFLNTGTYTPNNAIGNGSIAGWSGRPVTNSKIYNNTLVNLSGLNIGFWFDPGTIIEAQNNLFFDSSGTLDTLNFRNVDHDYNWFTGGDTHGEPNGVPAAGFDPFMNAGTNDLRLAMPADPGLPLPEPYDIDFASIPRGNGNWDMGAYEHISDPDFIAPPTNLRVVTGQ